MQQIWKYFKTYLPCQSFIHVIVLLVFNTLICFFQINPHEKKLPIEKKIQILQRKNILNIFQKLSLNAVFKISLRFKLKIFLLVIIAFRKLKYKPNKQWTNNVNINHRYKIQRCDIYVLSNIFFYTATLEWNT